LEVGKIWRTWILNGLEVNASLTRWFVSFAELSCSSYRGRCQPCDHVPKLLLLLVLVMLTVTRRHVTLPQITRRLTFVLKQTRPSVTSLMTSKRVSWRTSCSNSFAIATCWRSKRTVVNIKLLSRAWRHNNAPTYRELLRGQRSWLMTSSDTKGQGHGRRIFEVLYLVNRARYGAGSNWPPRENHNTIYREFNGNVTDA